MKSTIHLPPPLVHVDMDGTLCDFEGALKAKMAEMATPGEQSYWEEQANEPSYITVRRRLVKTQPGFWRNLPKLKVGFDILEMLYELKFRVMILTKAPRSNTAAWAEKVEWVNLNIGSHIPITMAPDKSLVYGKCLVDDWIPYMEPWLAARPRGLGVMPTNDRNRAFKHPNLVHYDGTRASAAEVFERLRVLRATCAPEEVSE